MSYFSTPGFFNVLDNWAGSGSPIQAGTVSYLQAQQNALIIQNAIWAAQIATATSCGSEVVAAEVVIPGHSVVPHPVGGGGTDYGAEYFLAIPAVNAMKGAAIVINCNWPVKIRGTGNVKLVMMKDTSGNTGEMFQIDTSSGGDNIGGLTFEDLELRYPQFTDGSGNPIIETYTAIHVLPAGAQNMRLVRMIFSDCPRAVNVENGLQTSIVQCTFKYSVTGNIGTALILGNTTGDAVNEVYIDGCLFDADQAPKGSTGLIIYGAEHVKMSDSRINSFLNGIQITPGPTNKNALRCNFTSVAVYANTTSTSVVGTALLIQPQVSTDQMHAAQIAQMVFQGCYFELAETATPVSPGGPGIIVDGNNASGSNPAVLDNVRFISCYVTRWPGPGLQVKGGVTNLEVLGGFYAGNNYGSVTSQPYGIYIQQATGVRIIGANCIGKYQWVTIGTSTTSPQQSYGIYLDSGAASVLIANCDIRNNFAAGIYVKGGAQDIIIEGCDVTANHNTNGVVVDATSAAVNGVFIRNCNASGYSGGYSAAISAAGSAANLATLQVTDCAGYNDQSVTLTHSYPSGGLANFHGYSLGYYGPLEFYIVGASVTISSIKIGTVTTGLLQGSFLLMPGEDAIVSWTPPTGTLTIPAIGK